MTQATPLRLLAVDTDQHSLEIIAHTFARDRRLLVLTADNPGDGIARHSVESSGSRVTHSTTPFSV
jgi:hypothetical protein